MSAAESGANRTCGQRDRTVGKQRVRAGPSPGRTPTTDGGSSSVFSSAFCAASSSVSASSMMTTRQRPSNGRYPTRSISSRTTSTLMLPASGSGASMMHVGMHTARDAAAGRARSAGIEQRGSFRRRSRRLGSLRRIEAKGSSGPGRARPQCAACPRRGRRRTGGWAAATASQRPARADAASAGDRRCLERAWTSENLPNRNTHARPTVSPRGLERPWRADNWRRVRQRRFDEVARTGSAS